MFKIIDNPTFTVEIAVQVPADGGHDRQTLKATYNVVPVDEFTQFDLDSTEGSEEFLKRALHSLDDIEDEQGARLTYCHTLRDRLLKLPYVRTALSRGYFDNINKAALGN